MLARWLHEELLSRPGVSAGQVAFLFRKLTQADGYLDALRRYDIPYLIEGEKHYYRRQEVIDLVNRPSGARTIRMITSRFWESCVRRSAA